jgi:hypothetical protein
MKTDWQIFNLGIDLRPSVSKQVSFEVLWELQRPIGDQINQTEIEIRDGINEN